MKLNEIIRFLVLRTIGYFLVLFAIYGVIATFGPALYYQAQFEIIKMRGINFQVAAAKTEKTINRNESTFVGGDLGALLAGSQQQILIPKDTLFSIVIPKIGANSRIIANVDPSNEKQYLPLLQEGVAHAKGSVFPGMIGNTYLFAHSTDNFWDVGRYNAVFYLLKDLSKGDEVIVFFRNVRYNYVVYDTKIVSGSDVSYLVDSQKGDKETLILQTCWPPGTAWRRLLVFAKPKGS
jgi:LPXTG-site transpeptidase (sortase) family protein